jgi:hypothetical protein
MSNPTGKNQYTGKGMSAVRKKRFAADIRQLQFMNIQKTVSRSSSILPMNPVRPAGYYKKK